MIIFSYTKTNTDETLNFFNSINNSFNLFLIIGLVLISCNSGSKRFKILILQWHTQLSRDFNYIISTYFSTSSGVI